MAPLNNQSIIIITLKRLLREGLTNPVTSSISFEVRTQDGMDKGFPASADDELITHLGNLIDYLDMEAQMDATLLRVLYAGVTLLINNRHTWLVRISKTEVNDFSSFRGVYSWWITYAATGLTAIEIFQGTLSVDEESAYTLPDPSNPSSIRGDRTEISDIF